jgi:hypothetical protein
VSGTGTPDVERSAPPEESAFLGRVLDEGRGRHFDNRQLQPVDFATIDMGFVQERLAKVCAFAARVVKGRDAAAAHAGPLCKLALAAVEMLVAGTCVDGLQLDVLADRAGIGRGRLDAHLREGIFEMVDLAIRALFVLDRRRVFYEEAYGLAVEARRDSKRRGSGDGPGRCVLGFEQHHQTPGSLRFAGLALGGSERHLASVENALTTGTHHDWSCARADETEISHLTAVLGERPYGSYDEHLRALLGVEGRVRVLWLRASRNDPTAFDLLGVDIDVNELAEAVFSDRVLATSIPVGPPQRRRQLFDTIVQPGDDRTVIDGLVAAGRSGVAMRTLGPRLEIATPAQLESAGWRRKEVPMAPFHELLGVDRPVFGREWWHHEATHRLIRKVAVRGVGMAVQADEWQIFGRRRENLALATALIERYHQPWPLVCLTTAAEQCAPGRIYARKPEQQAGIRAVLRLARAVAVSADRDARRRGGAGADAAVPQS